MENRDRLSCGGDCINSGPFNWDITSWEMCEYGRANVLAVHRLLGVSWNAIDDIKARAVVRGLSRREECRSVHVCVDEPSFWKRHDDVTVVSDFTTGTVHCVGDGRRKGTLDQWYRGLSQEQLGSIERVSMDMWPADINSTLKHVPGSDDRIA